MRWISSLPIAILLCSQGLAQVVPFDDSVVVKQKGGVSDKPKTEDDLSSVKPYLVTDAGTVHSQLRTLYQYCPGMVTGFEKMRSLPQLKMSELEGFVVFNKKLNEAIEEREKFMEEAMSLGTGPIFLQKKFVDRVLATEVRYDEALSEIFSEIVIPQKIPTYLSALGPGFENNLLTSKVFGDYAQLSTREFDQRLRISRDFVEWAVKSAYSKDINFAVGKAKLRLLYRDLTVKEFLDFKYLLGQSRAGETIEEHLARIRKNQADLADYVLSVEAVKTKK